jgi:serine/threonine protein phosphatase 1
MGRFVIGDIHGAYKALLQCLERSGFDRKEDLLISLGDLGDGWPDVVEVFDELLSVRNRVVLLGNHDSWLLRWFQTGNAPDIWLIQGGDTTVKAFRKGATVEQKNLLQQASLYHILGNNLFVHGGYLPDIPLEKQDKEVFLWDRSLVKTAISRNKAGNPLPVSPYTMVYVGHTPTINFDEQEPIITNGLCMMDTGAGWPGGRLTLTDIDTGKIYQSDPVDELYAGIRGRNA